MNVEIGGNTSGSQNTAKKIGGVTAAVVTFLLLLNQFIVTFWPVTAQITAECRYDSTPANSELLMRHMSTLNLFRFSVHRALGKEESYLPGRGVPIDPEVEGLVTRLWADLTDARPPGQTGFPTFFQCVVRNTGTKDGKDVKLVLPVRGQAVADSRTDRWRDFNSNEIELGTLSPNTFVVVWVLSDRWDDWHRNRAPILVIEDGIALSHSDGVGTVVVATSVSNLLDLWRVALRRYPYSIIGALLFAAVCGWAIPYLIRRAAAAMAAMRAKAPPGDGSPSTGASQTDAQ